MTRKRERCFRMERILVHIDLQHLKLNKSVIKFIFAFKAVLTKISEDRILSFQNFALQA